VIPRGFFCASLVGYPRQRNATLYELRAQTVETMNRLRLPHGMIGDLAGVRSQRIGDFARGVSLPKSQEDAITQAVFKVGFVWDSFQNVIPKIRILIDDPKELDRLFAACQAHELEKQLAELSEVTEQSFAQVCSVE
jgi:hypothetical protein